MSRKKRIIYEGAIYHIYQRGNNKDYIFEDDVVKSFFLKYLKEYNKKFDYEVLAYVIMNNHYHILIRTNKSPINEIMFYLNNILGKYIKTKLNRTGHSFDGRYKYRLVESDAYLIWLLRYIHRNPIKANICSKLDDYQWSSHCYYKNNIISHINTRLILDMLASSREAAVARYLKLVNSTGDEIDMERDYEIIKGMLEIKETDILRNNDNGKELERRNRKTFDDIIANLNIYADTLNSIRSGSKKQSLTPIKLIIIRGAVNEGYSLKEISDYLNAAPSTISKLISRNNVV